MSADQGPDVVLYESDCTVCLKFVSGDAPGLLQAVMGETLTQANPCPR